MGRPKARWASPIFVWSKWAWAKKARVHFFVSFLGPVHELGPFLTALLVVVGLLILFYSIVTIIIVKKLDDWRESQPIGETFIVYGGPCLEG